MKRRIKTKKKKIKKYKSRNKLKSRKIKKRLKGGALQMATAAAGLAVGTGALAYMGKDGPRKCMFEDCQSHYYHFYGHRGWWDNSTRFYQGGEKANRLDNDYDGENPVCPKCVKRYNKGIREGLLIMTLNGYKVCDNSCGSCDNKFCGDSWWKPYIHGIYKELKYYRRSINGPDELQKIEHTYETDCPECKGSIRKRKCLICKQSFELVNGGLDYCISCKGYGEPKEIFNLNGNGLKVGGILIFQEDSKEYKAKIENIFDNQLLRCEILSLNINEWNDIELPWLSNKQVSDEVYMVGKTIIVINDLQICLRRLSLAKLYDLDVNIIIYIKEILDIILKPNVKPWVSIDDPSRSEYKSLLEREREIERERRERDEGKQWGSFSN